VFIKIRIKNNKYKYKNARRRRKRRKRRRRRRRRRKRRKRRRRRRRRSLPRIHNEAVSFLHDTSLRLFLVGLQIHQAPLVRGQGEPFLMACRGVSAYASATRGETEDSNNKECNEKKKKKKKKKTCFPPHLAIAIAPETSTVGPMLSVTSCSATKKVTRHASGWIGEHAVSKWRRWSRDPTCEISTDRSANTPQSECVTGMTRRKERKRRKRANKERMKKESKKEHPIVLEAHPLPRLPCIETVFSMKQPMEVIRPCRQATTAGSKRSRRFHRCSTEPESQNNSCHKN
jgi:hypothetical protein